MYNALTFVLFIAGMHLLFLRQEPAEKSKALVDIAVRGLPLIKCDPKDILKMNVEMTVVDGKIVLEVEK